MNMDMILILIDVYIVLNRMHASALWEGIATIYAFILYGFNSFCSAGVWCEGKKH